MFVEIMSVITLIGIIAIPIMERRNRKKKYKEEMRMAAETIAEIEREELIEAIRDTQKEVF